MKSELRSLALAGVCSLAMLASHAHAQPIGQWDFESGNLAATVGPALTYVDGPGNTTEHDTVFGTTTSLGIPDIGGAVARVMGFPLNDAFTGYIMPVVSAPNGGGIFVNQWTLIMDVLYPTTSANVMRGIIETDGRIITSDSDLFVNATGGLGVDGQFDGQIRANTWYRIGFVVDAANNQLRKYINGVLVGTQVASSGATPALDGRWALDPASGAQLFNDDSNPPESAPGYVNSIQLRNIALSTPQMQALGGPTASGIPTVIPPIPMVLERKTPRGPFANPTTDYGMVLSLGDNVVNASSVSMRLDGTLLASPTVTIANGFLTASKANTGALTVGTEHSIVVTAIGSVDGTRSFTNTFRVVAFYEDFEDLVLGATIDERIPGTNVWTATPPPGWMIDDTGVPGYEDPSTDGVTEWAGWSFANRIWWSDTAEDQNRSLFTRASGTVAIADPDEWDDATHTSGLYNAIMKTPPISIAGLATNSMFIRFDSSWRPECCDDNAALANDQTASVMVSFDGAAPIEVMRWSSDGSKPNFHPDSENEGVTIAVNNPAGASSVVVTFGLLLAENDWWWAIDNIVVSAGVKPPTITAQPTILTATEGDLVSLSVTASGGAPLSYQWYRGSGATRTIIAGATSATLNLPNLKLTDSGVYTVQVSNPGGSIDSGPIQLVVLPLVNVSVTNDLVVHLKFDGDATDSSGRGNNGTEVGAPTYVEGRLGQALRYSNDKEGTFFNYVTLGNVPDVQFGTDVSFSISFWARFTTWTDDPAFLSNKNWNSGNNPGWVIATAGDGRLQWNAAPNRIDYDGPGGTMSDNQWHHVVMTWDRGGFITTYLDGVQVNNTPNGLARDLNSGLPTNIGQDGTGTYTDNGGAGMADGTIDDVGIWRRVLSEAEVKAIYRAALAGKDLSQATLPPPVGRDLVVYMPFDGNLTDASGRNNNGTSVGSTPFVAGRLGQAVSYLSLANGSSFNYVSLGRPADLNFGLTTSFAFSFWSKLNSWQGDPAFLSNKDWDSGNNPGWVLATADDGRIQWNIAASPTGGTGTRRDYDSGGGYFNDHGWHHVVVAFERIAGSGRARTYVDGARINETTWSGTDNQLDTVAPRNTNIGQDGIGDYTDGNSVGVDGAMDELVIWRRALGDDEVSGLYAAGLLGVQANAASPGLTLQLPPSGLKISTVNGGTTLRLTWQANAGVRLQQSSSLGATASWQDVPGTLSYGQYETAAGPQNLFYRLRRK